MPRAQRSQDTVHLDDLRLAPQWRAWLLARSAEEGGLAGALRAVICEAALADVCRLQYEKEEELHQRLLDAGRTENEVRRLIVRWRRGEAIEGMAIGPPAAARVLHPGVVSRVPQVRRVRVAGDRQRGSPRSSRRSGADS